MITNQAIAKLSPTLPLIKEQESLVNRILHFSQKHLHDDRPAVFTIQGDAGTGKSVVFTHLFARIQEASRHQPASPFFQTTNCFTVNHPEILKVYRELAGRQPSLLKKDFQRPTSLINKLNKNNQSLDIVIVDEAHLLLSKPDHYNNFYHNNQLTELLKRSRIVVLVIDYSQVLRMKSLWTPGRLAKIIERYPHEEYQLTHQFRMQASDELIKWFNTLTGKQVITALPTTARQGYDFRIYNDAESMRQAIVERNKEVGLSRILSTSGYPSTLDGGKHYIQEGAFRLPWDQYNFTSIPWAELPQTINEVGSIYTCQGFDLNYAGIIIGPVISQRPHSRQLQVNLDRFTDTEAFKKRQDLSDPHQIDRLKKWMIMNALNVILKRGVRGTYLYAHDPLLRQTLYSLFADRGWEQVVNS